MFDAQRDACVAAAQAGGQVLLGYFRQLDPATITEKTKNDVVSEADRASEAAIRNELAARFPQYGFLGEEGGFIPPEARGSGGTQRPEGPGGPPRESSGEEGGFIPPEARGSGGTERPEGPGGPPRESSGEEGGFIPPEARGCGVGGSTSASEASGSGAQGAPRSVEQRPEGPGGPPRESSGEEGGSHGNAEIRWIVDPLDGTLNFVHGFPHWCVSVALWDAEGPVAGCVLDPLRNDCFLAVRGQGSTWNGKAMRVSQQAGLDGAFLATGFAFQLGDRWPAFNAALNRVFPRAKGLRRAGSAALDLAHVACGIFDGFFEMGLQPWDIAAGALLVREAGGVITDWEGGQDWFDSGNLVAGTPGVAADLLDVLRG